jgi:hypothetical protein
MTRTELLEIVNNGESSGVEFKCDVLQNHDLAKELVAFSNLAGGMVLLGVDDDGTIGGLTRADLEEWVMTTCRDKIRPAIIPFLKSFAMLNPEGMSPSLASHAVTMFTGFGTTTAIGITSASERRAGKPLRKNSPGCSNSEGPSGPNYGQSRVPHSPISTAGDCGITSAVSSRATPARPRSGSSRRLPIATTQAGELCSSTPRS